MLFLAALFFSVGAMYKTVKGFNTLLHQEPYNPTTQLGKKLGENFGKKVRAMFLNSNHEAVSIEIQPSSELEKLGIIIENQRVRYDSAIEHQAIQQLVLPAFVREPIDTTLELKVFDAKGIEVAQSEMRLSSTANKNVVLNFAFPVGINLPNGSKGVIRVKNEQN
ncbi:MAG: hypothetical protein ACI8ZN_002688 [Bacteroidia bacterium]|jgi:hypothetical protein